MFRNFIPQPLQSRKDAFDDSEWLFELKYDGFRALAYLENGECQFVSRNGHSFASFAELGRSIAQSLPTVRKAVLDGEIVCVDRKGHPQFKDLLFHKGNPCFFAFDLLHDGKDRRLDALIERKQNLRRLLTSLSKHSRIKYADHFDGLGSCFFQRVCALDLEGVVAKYKNGRYESEIERSTWFKIRNKNYSQMTGRAELFERDRHKEPVPGWHSCAIACIETTLKFGGFA